MNRLSKEKSAYLKHAANQKIDWYPWSNSAFEIARKEDKPLFLSTGAVWCHWCHVMAKESFENEDIIKLLNENFINIKLDRDERPDIDRLYQQAAAAMGHGSGWPLSMFLTPDRKPFFGGTYFPPEDKFGRPGFKKVLKSVIDFYKTKRSEISPYSDRLVDVLRPKPLSPGEITTDMIDSAVESILSETDHKNGGFGNAPKFPMPGAIEFLINRYALEHKDPAKYAVTGMLESMAKGGIHDHLEGGFHRYSTDEKWIIPHFEKMADDNAWLLRNYIYAYSVFGNSAFKNAAAGIINFMFDVLSDPQGGFYASQDADVTPSDEGGYFTWTDEDFRKVLDDEEYSVMSLLFLSEAGSMSHNRSKKVLFISMGEEEIAEKTGKDVEQISEIIKRGKAKLLIQRNKREIPFIDKTLYTSLNGMVITSFLKAYRILRENRIRDFALKSLNRITEKQFLNSELYHSKDVKAFLEDYIFLTEAFISAYEVTGDTGYLDRADTLMETCIDRFWDRDEGGFFESDEHLLGIKLKGIEDSSRPSSNSAGIMVLLKLFHMTDKEMYYQYAEKALRAFSAVAQDQGFIAGFYFASLDAYFNLLKLTLNTSRPDLINEALTSFCPYTCIVYGDDRGHVVPCRAGACLEPIDDPESLREILEKV